MLQETVEGLAEILQQMEAIGDLLRVRRAASGTIRVEIAAIPRDHADTGACVEPRRDRIGGALGEQIDHAMPCEVAEDRAVASPFLPRPVVHTNHLGPDGERERCRAHEAQQRLVARWHPEVAGETGTGLAAEGDADLGERGEQAVAPTRTGGDEGGEALTEGPPRAGRGATEEAAGVDHEGDGATAAGEIGDTTLVATMDGRRRLMTERTGCRTRRGVGDEREPVGVWTGADDA